MEEILGHKKILNFFEKNIEKNNLSHAYLFLGPEKIGKKTVAKYLASSILNASVLKLNTIPDYFFVTIEKNKKTKKTNKNINVEQVRELKRFLMQSSFKKDSYKIIIIDNADLLSPGAGNSLLKILEEPNKKTIFFLITSDESKILNTIKSRCQILNFSLVNKKEIETKFTPELLENYNGLIGELIEESEDEEKKEFYKKERNRFLALFNKDFAQKLKLIEDLFGDKTDNTLARKKIHKILNIWLIELHNFIKKIDFEKKNKKEIDNILKIEKEIKNARKMILENIHPRLLLENIILEIP